MAVGGLIAVQVAAAIHAQNGSRNMTSVSSLYSTGLAYGMAGAVGR